VQHIQAVFQRLVSGKLSLLSGPNWEVLMNRRTWRTIAVAILLCWEVRTASATNLVTNGSFEGGTVVDPATGDILPAGWTLGPPSPANLSKINIDSATNPATDLGPEDGTHYARFQPPATNGTRDCLLQDISTVAGKQYVVSFWVAATSTSVGNNSGMDPVWDENTVNATALGTNKFYFPANNTAPVAYQFFSFLETATTNLTRLDFHGIDQNGSILLDNVAVALFSVQRGDFNRDGQVTTADIPAMLTALTDLNTYASDNSLSPTQLAVVGDFDNSGTVTNSDIQGLLDLVASVSGGSPTAVPEPASLFLILSGAVAISVRRFKHRKL
jgi:hypothetical protein